MLLVWRPSPAADAAGREVLVLAQPQQGGYGLPGATGETSALLWMRQRRVAAKAGLSSA
jgi:hypothetical protein